MVQHRDDALAKLVEVVHQAAEYSTAEGLVEVVHQAVEYLAAEGLTKTRAASESIRERQVLALAVLESLCQAEDQNGSDF